jgi:hypothetical protein
MSNRTRPTIEINPFPSTETHTKVTGNNIQNLPCEERKWEKIPRIAQRDGAQFVGYMGDCVVAPSQGYQMAVFDELSSLSPQVLLRLFR